MADVGQGYVGLSLAMGRSTPRTTCATRVIGAGRERRAPVTDEPDADLAGRPGAPDVSVIIPAHNAGPYLDRCLDSVVAQTIGLDRMEVVVVDDGSTDGTGEAADSWAARYPDVFRVVHNEVGSGGPAAPRNTALDLVTGRYVFFLDADDHLGHEALQRLVAAADENGSDVVAGQMSTSTGRGLPNRSFRRTDLDADVFTSDVYWSLSALKLFRRELLEKNKIRFPTEFPILSDQPFTALAYLRARRISVLADYDYYFAEWRDDGKHVTRSGSVSDRIDVVEAMCALVLREVADPVGRSRLLSGTSREACGGPCGGSSPSRATSRSAWWRASPTCSAPTSTLASWRP